MEAAVGFDLQGSPFAMLRDAAMVEHHETTKYPPVRGLKEPVSDPFADLEDDLPWEEKS